MSSGSASAGAGRLQFIDGLRALALIMVLLRHFYMRAYSFGLPPWTRVLGLGYLGVSLFLLLSGFCVSWAYLGPKARPFVLQDFVKLRVTRILPAYYVALALSAVLAASSLTAPQLAWQVATHALLIHNLFPSTVLGLVEPFWSLALECQLYAFFPLVFLGFKRFGIWRTLAAVALLQTAFRIYVMRFGTDYTTLTFVLPWSVFGRLFEFALGVVAAHLISHGTLARFPRTTACLPLVALLGLGAGYVSKSSFGVTHPLTDAAWVIGFFAVLLWAASGRRLNRALSYRPLVALGVASYSAYLVHEMAMPYVFTMLAGWPPFDRHLIGFAPLVLAVTLIPCFAFFYLVEQPAITWFRGRRAKGTAALVARPPG